MIRARLSSKQPLGRLREGDVCLFESSDQGSVAISFAGRVAFHLHPSLEQGVPFNVWATSADSWFHFQRGAVRCDPNRIPAHRLLVVFRDDVFHVVEDATSPGDSVLPNRLGSFLDPIRRALVCDESAS